MKILTSVMAEVVRHLIYRLMVTWMNSFNEGTVDLCLSGLPGK